MRMTMAKHSIWAWSLDVFGLAEEAGMAMHAYNSIIKFADDTTVVSLITNNDETAYREEVRDREG